MKTEFGLISSVVSLHTKHVPHDMKFKAAIISVFIFLVMYHVTTHADLMQDVG